MTLRPNRLLGPNEIKINNFCLTTDSKQIADKFNELIRFL